MGKDREADGKREIKQQEKEKSVGGVEERRAESTCIGRGGGR